MMAAGSSTPATANQRRRWVLAAGLVLAVSAVVVALGVVYGGGAQHKTASKDSSAQVKSLNDEGPIIQGPKSVVTAPVLGLPDSVNVVSPATPAQAGSSSNSVINPVATSKAAEMAALFNKLANNKTDAAMESALDQFSKAVVKQATCNPTDAKGLLAAVKNKCLYIKLVPGVAYKMNKTTINITYPVAIVGDPFRNPIIDGRKTKHTFQIFAGGFLDLQFARVYRGTEQAIHNGDFSYIRGGSLLIQPGGGATLLGVLFINPVETTFDVNAKGLILAGGHILMYGGVLTLTDTHFINQTPLGLRAAMAVGGDILLLGGVLIENGCTHTQVSAIAIGVGVAGLFVNIMGGVGIFNGCAFSRSIGANFIAGAGIQHFIGGGVGIYSGCAFNTNGGLFAFFGAAVHQFLGAGVMINSGVVSNFNFGLNIACGLGPFISIGAGVHHSSGCVYNINAGAGFLAVDGGQIFLGAGHASFVGTVFSRTFGLVSAWGIGGTAANSAGDLEIIGVPTGIEIGLAATGFLSLQKFVAAGYFFGYRSPSLRAAAVYLRLGQGTVVWMGAGNITIVECRDTFRGALGFFNKPQYRFYVAAHNVNYLPKRTIPPLLKPARPIQTKPPHHPPKPALTQNPGSTQRAADKAAKANETTKARARGRGRRFLQDADLLTQLQQQQGDSSDTASTEAVDSMPTVAADTTPSLITPLAGFVNDLPPSKICLKGVHVLDVTKAEGPIDGKALISNIDGTSTVTKHEGPIDGKALFSNIDGTPTVTDADSVDCDTPWLGGGEIGSCSIADSSRDGCAAEKATTGIYESTYNDVCTAKGADACSESSIMTFDNSWKDNPDRYRHLAEGDELDITLPTAGSMMMNPINVGGSIYITRADVVLTCKDESCADTDSFKAVIADYLNLDARAKLAVSSDMLDPLVADLFTNSELATGFADDTTSSDSVCSSLVQFNVYVVTKDDDQHKQAKAALNALNEDGVNAQMLAALQAKEMNACLVAAHVSFDYGVPLIDTKTNAVGDTSGSSIIPAVGVLDKAGVKAVDSISPGDSVTLSLSKFPTDQKATVKLINQSGKAAATVGTVTPASKKDTFDWTVPSDLAPGYYYLSASPASNIGVVAMSKLIEVKSA